MAFLTLGGAEYLVGRFERLPDEVGASGRVARAWRADVFCASDAAAAALRALASHNLRRTVGWQLRGQGHGDVTMGGDGVGGGSTVVRFTVEGDNYGHAEEGSSWYRVLTLHLREQVSP